MKQQIVTTGLPTLEEALTLASFINRPLNNHIVLLGAIAPKVSTSGVVVGQKFQEEAQTELNRKGVMVVIPPATNHQMVNPGEIVMFRQDTQLILSRVVTSSNLHDGLDLEEGAQPTKEMYKQYVVIVINASDLTLVVNKEQNGA